jgi:hypothetical protein
VVRDFLKPLADPGSENDRFHLFSSLIFLYFIANDHTIFLVFLATSVRCPTVPYSLQRFDRLHYVARMYEREIASCCAAATTAT